MRLASRFGRYNSIRRERPLTDDELMQFVPSVFSGDTRAAGHTGTRMSHSQQTREPVRPTPTILPVPWCHTSAPFTPKKVPVCMNMPRTPVSQKHPGK